MYGEETDAQGRSECPDGSSLGDENMDKVDSNAVMMRRNAYGAQLPNRQHVPLIHMEGVAKSQILVIDYNRYALL